MVRKLDEKSGETSDEEILNVFRRSEESVLGTSEVAAKLNIGDDQTRNRLNDLHEEERVGSRKIGNTRVWVLSPSEPTRVVDPEIARIQQLCREIKLSARWVAITGGGAFVVGGVLLIAYLSAIIGELSTAVPPNEIATWGLGLLGAGGFVAFLGGLFIAGAEAAERLAARTTSSSG